MLLQFLLKCAFPGGPRLKHFYFVLWINNEHILALKSTYWQALGPRKQRGGLIPSRHRTSSERLMYVQFTSCVYGV